MPPLSPREYVCLGLEVFRPSSIPLLSELNYFAFLRKQCPETNLRYEVQRASLLSSPTSLVRRGRALHRNSGEATGEPTSAPFFRE